MDLFGKSDPITIGYQKRNGVFIEVGRTEVIPYAHHIISYQSMLLQLFTSYNALLFK